MAYDGITTKNMVHELRQSLLNARVEKIYVPNKNEVYINFHTQNRENLKLLISIDANNARIHLTKYGKENPVKAPQICMILRKHLQGAKLISILQHGLDRVVTFAFQNLNELGDLVEKKLVVELMGKYSNVILLNDTNTVIDSMRHVDITMSSVREVLPGKAYSFPSTLGKVNLMDLSYEAFHSLFKEADDSCYTDTFLSNHLVGISKSFAMHFLEVHHMLHATITDEETKTLFQLLRESISSLDEKTDSFLLLDTKKDYVIDFQHECKNDLVSNFLDEFYHQKESVSLIKTAKLNLKHDVDSHLSKLNKKLSLALQTLHEAKDYEKYRQYGELLNCHMHLVKMGMESITVTNYYDNNQEVTIPLQKNVTPSRNAQNYFKKYTKAKNSMEHATKYQAEYENQIDYLTSVLSELELAESLEDVDEIRNELIHEGYLTKHTRTHKNKEQPSEPLTFIKDDVCIRVGKNNLQNDRLTFKIAKKNDTWLHVKGFHGSHVIIESESISDEVLYYAATLAIQYSEVKGNTKVEVDYCLVKHVHKEVGSAPGKVVYTDYHTIIV